MEDSWANMITQQIKMLEAQIWTPEFKTQISHVVKKTDTTKLFSDFYTQRLAMASVPKYPCNCTSFIEIRKSLWRYA